MPTQHIKHGNISISWEADNADKEYVHNSPAAPELLEVRAVGVSTLDGKAKTMALMVPFAEAGSIAQLAAYVAHNAYLVP